MLHFLCRVFWVFATPCHHKGQLLMSLCGICLSICPSMEPTTTPTSTPNMISGQLTLFEQLWCLEKIEPPSPKCFSLCCCCCFVFVFVFVFFLFLAHWIFQNPQNNAVVLSATDCTSYSCWFCTQVWVKQGMLPSILVSSSTFGHPVSKTSFNVHGKNPQTNFTSNDIFPHQAQTTRRG